MRINIRKLLIPSKKWQVRIYTLFFFVLIDYIITCALCKDFKNEGNLILRKFMIYFNSVYLGILIFTLSFYLPTYIILCYFTNCNMEKLRKFNIVELIYSYKKQIFDVILGLGVAARHFEGAMSWILPLSNRLCLLWGFLFYLIIVYVGTFIKNIGIY